MRAFRGLETLADPTVKGGGPDHVLEVAGESLRFTETVAHAARDEISQARALRMGALGLEPSGLRRFVPVTREKEVIPREVVRIACRY